MRTKWNKLPQWLWSARNEKKIFNKTGDDFWFQSIKIPSNFKIAAKSFF